MKIKKEELAIMKKILALVLVVIAAVLLVVAVNMVLAQEALATEVTTQQVAIFRDVEISDDRIYVGDGESWLDIAYNLVWYDGPEAPEVELSICWVNDNNQWVYTYGTNYYGDPRYFSLNGAEFESIEEGMEQHAYDLGYDYDLRNGYDCIIYLTAYVGGSVVGEYSFGVDRYYYNYDDGGYWEEESSGGCNAGLGIAALVLLIPMIFLKRK